ncbi:L-type lectin-domain containing receptor kinase VIII.1 [Sesamum alatum]|uniref:L-type lectin-domain containing receptor kinase VIII.1 n=1 Tax=Sesamum alatum TaxID=300844 RepID=A0AAE1YDT9_9LAMI|nr:L-type lectin-domain containing receptor kinase VIII.1 [Sesamum alatum]
MKRTITDWALPLACERKLNELADPRLDGKYVEEELKRIIFVGLICAHNRPEKRPTILEVVDLLKGDREKFAAIESDEMFRSTLVADSGENDGSKLTSDEKESKQEIASD